MLRNEASICKRQTILWKLNAGRFFATAQNDSEVYKKELSC
nr:hypothetical protein [Mucilaginibacter sp. X5P1]